MSENISSFTFLNDSIEVISFKNFPGIDDYFESAKSFNANSSTSESQYLCSPEKIGFTIDVIKDISELSFLETKTDAVKYFLEILYNDSDEFLMLIDSLNFFIISDFKEITNSINSVITDEHSLKLFRDVMCNVVKKLKHGTFENHDKFFFEIMNTLVGYNDTSKQMLQYVLNIMGNESKEIIDLVFRENITSNDLSIVQRIIKKEDLGFLPTLIIKNNTEDETFYHRIFCLCSLNTSNVVLKYIRGIIECKELVNYFFLYEGQIIELYFNNYKSIYEYCFAMTKMEVSIIRTKFDNDEIEEKEYNETIYRITHSCTFDSINITLDTMLKISELSFLITEEDINLFLLTILYENKDSFLKLQEAFNEFPIGSSRWHRYNDYNYVLVFITRKILNSDDFFEIFKIVMEIHILLNSEEPSKEIIDNISMHITQSSRKSVDFYKKIVYFCNNFYLFNVLYFIEQIAVCVHSSVIVSTYYKKMWSKDFVFSPGELSRILISLDKHVLKIISDISFIERSNERIDYFFIMLDEIIDNPDYIDFVKNISLEFQNIGLERCSNEMYAVLTYLLGDKLKKNVNVLTMLFSVTYWDPEDVVEIFKVLSMSADFSLYASEMKYTLKKCVSESSEDLIQDMNSIVCLYENKERFTNSPIMIKMLSSFKTNLCFLINNIDSMIQLFLKKDIISCAINSYISNKKNWLFRIISYIYDKMPTEEKKSFIFEFIEPYYNSLWILLHKTDILTVKTMNTKHLFTMKNIVYDISFIEICESIKNKSNCPMWIEQIQYDMISTERKQCLVSLNFENMKKVILNFCNSSKKLDNVLKDLKKRNVDDGKKY